MTSDLKLSDIREYVKAQADNPEPDTAEAMLSALLGLFDDVVRYASYRNPAIFRDMLVKIGNDQVEL